MGAWRRLTALFLAILLMALVGACSGLSEAEPAPVDAVAQEEDLAPTPVPVGEGVNSEASGSTELVLWLPDLYDLDPTHTAGETLYTLRRLFEQTYPNVFLTLVNKAERGQAGLFNYLRSAQQVAPSIMPDVVILGSDELWQAADLGLIQPINPADLENIDDFYPFALDAVTYNQTLYGVPVSADVLHLVQDRNYGGEEADSLPLLASDVVSGTVPFIFAANQREPSQNLFLLLQYVASGGVLNEEGTLTEPDALGEVFRWLADARAVQIVPDTVLDFSSEDAVWAAFVEGDAGLAAVNARYYLSQREILENTGFGPIPTLDGAPATVAQTWAFAILTPDPERQALVLELIQEMLDPDVLGPLNQYNHRLPTRRSAFQAWADSHPYYQFLDSQLNLATAIPNGKAFADLAQRMQRAELDVLSGTVLPSDALLNVRATP